MTNDSLMKVENITDYFPFENSAMLWNALSDNWSLKPIFGLFESDRFRHVHALLYCLQVFAMRSIGSLI